MVKNSVNAPISSATGFKVTNTSSIYSSWKDHFTVVWLVAWPLNESEAKVYLVLMETSLLFLCKLEPTNNISMRTAKKKKQGQLHPHFHSKPRQLSTQL